MTSRASARAGAGRAALRPRAVRTTLVAVLLAGGLCALVAPRGEAAPLATATTVTAGSVTGTGAPAVRADDGTTLTWSVRPTPSEEHPDRPNFSFDVRGGDVIEDSIRVRNYGPDPLTLAIYASDALTTPSGALDLLPAGEEPKDVGAWITLATDSVEVKPGQFVDVPFTLAVPANAESGDHTGGIVTSVRSQSAEDSARPVVLDRRLGSRVYARVGGPLNPSLAITDLHTDYAATLNPIGPGALDVRYTVTNTGNVRLSAEQLISMRGLLGVTGQELHLERMPELLPGNSLTFTLRVEDVWPVLRTDTEVNLQAVPIRPGDVFETPVRASASAAVWTVPWSQLALLVAVAGAAVLWRYAHQRRRQREDARIRAAVDAALAGQDANTATPAAP